MVEKKQITMYTHRHAMPLGPYDYLKVPGILLYVSPHGWIVEQNPSYYHININLYPQP